MENHSDGLVIGVAIFIALPLGEKIHYGLDLKGGIHLLMQVVTDDAISAETDQRSPACRSS